MFFCRDALDIAGMSDIAQDAADQIQDDFMDKMEMFALYYVGKYSIILEKLNIPLNCLILCSSVTVDLSISLRGFAKKFCGWVSL